MSRTVFISAGESSGDAYGAVLSRLMRENSQDPLEFVGLGSKRMLDEGVRLVADSGRWGAISIVQSLKIIPRVLIGFYKCRWWLNNRTPDLFVPIDFGFGNVRLARLAKRKGAKVLYFIPPGSWRRDRQGKDLKEITDVVVTPFSWSEEILSANGVNAYWFGHPLKELLERSSISTERTGVAVLPGSRDHEIAENLPAIAKAISEPVEFALAPTSDTQSVIERWKRLCPDRNQDTFTIGKTAEVLARRRVAIVCSGTATLECALVGTPMVVVYRVSKAMELEAKLIQFQMPKFVSLPNILLDREVVPELIQDKASPDAIRSHLELLYSDGPQRQAQLDAFEEIASILGPNHAISETAKLGISMLNSPNARMGGPK